MLSVDALHRYSSPKIISFEIAAKHIENYKRLGKTVGLCHGGFDLLHPGHITHFDSAKKGCDILIVSVTSDQFVGGRKGAGRPVLTETLRAFAIANLQMVDYVVISDFQKGVEVIALLKPSFYVKGPDYIGKQTPGIISEREAIAAVGGEIIYTDDPKLSTSDIISYIKTEISE